MVIKYDGSKKIEELVKEGKVLVDYFAVWCAPCKMLGPILEQIAEETDIKIIKVDIDEYMEEARKEQIMSVPTMVPYINGQKQEKLIGLTSKAQILEIFN